MAKKSMKKMNSGIITLSNFKLYYTATVLTHTHEVKITTRNQKGTNTYTFVVY